MWGGGASYKYDYVSKCGGNVKNGLISKVRTMYNRLLYGTEHILILKLLYLFQQKISNLRLFYLHSKKYWWPRTHHHLCWTFPRKLEKHGSDGKSLSLNLIISLSPHYCSWSCWVIDVPISSYVNVSSIATSSSIFTHSSNETYSLLKCCVTTLHSASKIPWFVSS